MMNFVYIVSVYSLLIKLSYSGCHTGTTDADDRRLGIHTNEDTSWAQSNAKIFANIYANGAWQNQWRRLDNANCDDFQLDAVDYFDDFEDITSEWEGISLYNCGTDGLLIETLYYWDGTEEKTMHLWYSSVAGPFNQYCLYTSGVQADLNDPSTLYSEVFIDGDSSFGGMCEGVTFGTNGYYGTVWTGTGPGLPDCAQSEYGQVPAIPATIPNPSKYAPYINTNTDFEEKLVDYLMTVIGIAALLFVSNSCLITVLVKKRLSNPQYEYGKVYKTDME